MVDTERIVRKVLAGALRAVADEVQKKSKPKKPKKEIKT